MARFGSLGTQYFDDSGDPLVSGKIYFYETGTNTKKNTYADPELTILNSHPVLLSGAGRQPNIFFEGLARAVLTKNNGTQVEVRDPVATSDDTSTVIVNEIRERGILNWSDAVDYTEGALVIGSDNYVYRAAQASGPSTAAQDPTLTADYWFGPSDIRRPSMTADSVADLRSKFAGAPDKALVETLGYYTPGDGGSGRYRKDASDTTSLDNGGTIIVANDGARWKLVHSGVVSAMQFGATPSPGTDVSSFVQAAVNSGVKTITFDRGTYCFANTVFVPVGVEIICAPRNTIFKPIAGGAFTGGFILQWNTTDGTTWTQTFPNMNSGRISGCQFQNPDNIPAARAIQAFCALKAENLRFVNYRQSIKKPAGFYIDSFHISDVISEAPQDNTEYQFELLGLGDGLYIRDLHCPHGGGVTPLALRVRGCLGGKIEGSIGGDYTFEQCGSIDVSGGHLEQAQVVIDSSDIALRTSYLAPSNRIPIVIKEVSSDAGGSQRHWPTLDDITFAYVFGLHEFTGFDVQIDANSQASITNCRKKFSANGDLGKAQQHGITVCQSDGTTGISSFNNLSYIASKSAYIGPGYLLDTNYSLSLSDSGFNGISSVALVTLGTASPAWKIATGTYYYRVQSLYDKSRLVGRNQTNAEGSVTVSGTSQVPLITVDFSGRPRTGFMRIYRGTSTGSYTSFADVPTIGSSRFYDDGNVVNGVPWQARAASGVDTINSFGRHIRFYTDLVELSAGAQPTVGAWTLGDIIQRNNGTLDGSNMVLTGHYRLTTGSGHASGTDWANMRVSHVSPAT